MKLRTAISKGKHLVMTQCQISNVRKRFKKLDNAVTVRGGARNFGLGGPSCDVSILFKTNLYTHIN